jgi:gluconolactonase
MTASTLRLTPVLETDAHEGPVYVNREDALYFTTTRPNVAIRRLQLDGARFPLEPERLTTVCPITASANGMTLGPDGRLLVCVQGSGTEPATISALDPGTGALEPVVDGWHGLPLNSPNDVVVQSDGAIWFTDPSYGYLQGFRPRPALPDRLYRLDATTGELFVAADGFDKPNGLAFSPDESVLYVGDNGAQRALLAFDVRDGRRLGEPRTIAELPPEHPDGIEVDRQGRVYVSAPDAVRIYASTGELLDELVVPGAVNFTFGGRDGNVLFITADAAIWAAVLT